MRVPFIDLKAQYETIKDEINEAINEVLESCSFAGGPFVERFENEFARYCQCKYAIGVGSGTEAIWLSLLALGVGPGDEVITVPNTFIATAEAISFCGATPAFVDIDEKTYTMDPQKLDDYLRERFLNKNSTKTARPKAVIPVHLFGQMADMDPIQEIATHYGLNVIEDACQAHGAEYKGKRAGSIGDAGCFSFFPGKNLGAYGEAGAVSTNDTELAKKIQILRDHGQSRKYHHNSIGWNARMDGLQGAILGVKLSHLDEWSEARRQKAQCYKDLMGGLEAVVLPKEADYSKHVFHIYAILTRNRDSLIKYLNQYKISCGIHYPVPIHLSEAYRSLDLRDGSLGRSEKYARELVSLPIFPELDVAQISYVVKTIIHFPHDIANNG